MPIEGNFFSRQCILLYVVTMIAGGTVIAFLTPPFQAPDEDEHFFRAFQISRGEFIARRIDNAAGGYVDSGAIALNGLVSHLRHHSDQKLKPDQVRDAWAVQTEDRLVLQQFPITAAYAVFGYIPQATGIWLARATSKRVMVQLMTSRLFNLIAFVIILSIAMKIYPPCIPALLFFSALPMVMFIVSSASQDAMINSLTALFCAMLLRSISDLSCFPKDNVTSTATRNLLIGTTLVALILFLARPPLVALVILPIAVSLLSNDRNIWRWMIGATVAIMAIIGFYLQYLSKLGYGAVEGTDPQAQITAVFADPTKFPRAVWDTIQFRRRFYWQGMIGNLGWLDTQLPDFAYSLYVWLGLATAFALAASLSHYALQSSLVCTVSRRATMFIAVSAATGLVVILTFFSLYVVWTPPSHDLIVGVQGRYLLAPALIMITVGTATIISNSRASRWLQKIDTTWKLSQRSCVVLLGTIIFSQLLVAWVLVWRYYEL